MAASAKSEKAKKAAVVVPAGVGDEVVEALVSSVLAGLYHDVRFKSGEDVEKPAPLEELELLQVSEGSGAVDKAATMEAGVRLTKDLVAAPANYVTPSFLAETATSTQIRATTRRVEKKKRATVTWI